MSNFKKGQQVVAILSGAGVETASLQTIESVCKGIVRVEGSNVIYHDVDGRQTDGALYDFFSRLIALERIWTPADVKKSIKKLAKKLSK